MTSRVAQIEPTIRRANSSDIEALAQLGAATFTETFGHQYKPEDLATFLTEFHSQERWQKRLQEPGVAVWLAEFEGQAIGYATVGPCVLPVKNLEPKAGELRQLYLRGSAQGKQLGSRMLYEALEWLKIEGFAPLYIGVWSGNLRAQKFYEREGFTKVGDYDFPVGKHLDREFILRRGS